MIKIQNIYHMLAYVYSQLRQKQFLNAGTEEFENAAGLLATLLSRGVRQQLKQGIYREYQDEREQLALVRGKIDVAQSVKTRSVLLKQLVCEFDEYTIDNRLNQIIKATIRVLLGADISFEQKLELNRLLVHLREVTDIDVRKVSWRFRFNQHNQSYRVLMSVCQLVAEGLLQTDSKGTVRVLDYLHEGQMSDLFERFVREYYVKNHPRLNARATMIRWAGENDSLEFLPIMGTDTVLSAGSQTLIIDTKFYETPMLERHGARKYRSSHLYQVFAYVKNLQAQKDEGAEVSGLLLYAASSTGEVPTRFFDLSGSQVGVMAVNLDQDFAKIEKQLDEIPARLLAGSR